MYIGLSITLKKPSSSTRFSSNMAFHSQKNRVRRCTDSLAIKCLQICYYLAYINKNYPSNRIRTSDLRISAIIPLQSSALPTELSRDSCQLRQQAKYMNLTIAITKYFRVSPWHFKFTNSEQSKFGNSQNHNISIFCVAGV